MPEPKSRRRGAELAQAILDATWRELKDVGYTSLTIEGVASRAKTSKPVIYRRWPNRAQLVLAAWGSRVPETSRPAPDTGDLRTDLLTVFDWIARRVDSMMREVISGVMADAFRHPEIVEVLREQLRASPLTQVMEQIVDRAIERGELPPVRVPPRVGRLPLDLVRNETLTFGEAVTPETLTALVDDIYLPLLRGLAS